MSVYRDNTRCLEHRIGVLERQNEKLRSCLRRLRRSVLTEVKGLVVSGCMAGIVAGSFLGVPAVIFLNFHANTTRSELRANAFCNDGERCEVLECSSHECEIRMPIEHDATATVKISCWKDGCHL